MSPTDINIICSFVNLTVLSGQRQILQRQQVKLRSQVYKANQMSVGVTFKHRHKTMMRPGRLKLTQQLSFSVSIHVLAYVSSVCCLKSRVMFSYAMHCHVGSETKHERAVQVDINVRKLATLKCCHRLAFPLSVFLFHCNPVVSHSLNTVTRAVQWTRQAGSRQPAICQCSGLTLSS